jgi:small acid-soluble spore protein H (minor)
MRKREILKKNKKEMVSLDSERAKSIIKSKDVVQVLYQGSPVWIEGVSGNDIAEVTILTGGKQRIEVPVSRLVEEPCSNGNV